MKGYVYILTNEHMPGLVKIGKTTRDPESRALELYQTGVPSPFKVADYVCSPDCSELEQWVHKALASHRVSEGREFFSVVSAEAFLALSNCHQEQLSLWLDEFAPDHYLVDGYMFIDPGNIAELAWKMDEHPATVAASFWKVEPDEMRPAVRRHLDWCAQRRAEITAETEE